jgi:ubiquinone biosynthesis protein UbiJ
MGDEFKHELERGIQRIKDALAPYDRFVRGERERIESLRRELQALLDQLAELRAQVDRLTTTSECA